MPDLQVKDAINWNQPELLAWMDIISEYAIRYNLKEHDGQIIPITQIEEVIQNLPSDDLILRELTALAALAKKDDVPDLLSFLKINQDDILHIAHATIVAYRTREEGWFIAFNEDDPVVQKARSMAKLDLLMALESK